MVLVVGLGSFAAAPVSAGTSTRQIALGVAIRDPDEQRYDAFSNSAGRAPALWMMGRTWMGASNRFPRQELISHIRRNGSVPLVTWMPIDAAHPTDPNRVTWRSIRDGKFDRYIKRFARAARGSGGTVIIRLGHEMDGNWFPWGLCGTSSARKRQFIGAWRHVVRTFRGVGARNVRFLWSPHGPKGRCPSDDWQGMYPGSRFVDYVGVSGYNWGVPRTSYERRTRPWARWQTAVSVLGPGVRALGRVAPSKPIIIAELGSSPDAPTWTTKADWIRTGYPQMFAAYPGIVAIVYFNIDMSGGTNRHEDWRLISPNVTPLDAYREVLMDPRFQGSIS
jgi:hypothetical protein